MADGEGDGSRNEVHATGVRSKMPVFDDSNVKLFFQAIEWWFTASRITSDETKFCLVMSQVPFERLSELQSLIDDVPEQGKYTYIKPLLIEFFADSQQKRLRAALSHEKLGDRKPSQLYHRLKVLAADSLTESALIELWAAQLPEMAHAAVIQMKTAPIGERLNAADALMDSLNLRAVHGVQVNQASRGSAVDKAAAQTQQPPEPFPGFNVLMAKICELGAGGSSKPQRGRDQSRARGRSQSRGGRDASKSRTERTEHELCWYHWKFADRAKHCRSPCKWKKGSASESNQSA